MSAARRRLGRWIASGLLLSASFFSARAESAPARSRPEVFQEVWTTVRDNFFDPKLQGVDWKAARERYLPRATHAQTDEEFSIVVNQMLAELRTSHTHYYAAADPEYYQLCGIFWTFLETKLKPFLADGTARYSGIGISTLQSKDKTFVRCVFDGMPAATAGIKVGDQILRVDGEPFQPVRSFSGKAGQAVPMRVQRSKDASSILDLSVTPKWLDPATMFVEAMKASVQVVEKNGRKIGYIHIWSYAGEVYQEELEDELDGRLREADALVLDLRDGWGGANPNYLWPFVAPPLTMTSIARDGKRTDYRTAWTKPVCLLVNEGSKSGKEVFARYFQKAHRGPIVGSRTAGAVMAGRPFVMADGSLLYLAISDGLLDGERPEGNGVVPDIEVPFAPEYAAGADPQKERALEVASKARRPRD